MKVALHNIHLAGITGNKFHNYIVELVRLGFISHLFFDVKTIDIFELKKIRQTYSSKKLGLNKAKIIFSSKTLNRECDVLINFNSNKQQFTPAVMNFKGLKIFHLMDYFWNEPLSEKIARLQKYNIHFLMSYGSPDKYDEYFKKYAPEYTGKVIPVPFGFSPRFKATTEFFERKQKCVGLGSVRPLRLANVEAKNFIEEVIFFGPKELWFHKFRRILVEQKNYLKDYFDSLLPEFPRYRDYDYDMVAKFNEYQMFISDESIFYFPSAKTFEGPATKIVMCCSDHACFKDFGFIDNINCITHKEFNIPDLQKKLQSSLADQKKLQEISEAGYSFVTKEYNHTTIAHKLFTLISEIFNIFNTNNYSGLDCAITAYPIWRGERQITQTEHKNSTRILQAFTYDTLGLIIIPPIYMFEILIKIKKRIRLIFSQTWLGHKAYNLKRRWLNGPGVIETIKRSLHRHKKPEVTKPTETEEVLINTLRSEIANCTPIVLGDNDAAAQKWQGFVSTLRESITNEDPRFFLDWPVIRNNMSYKIDDHDFLSLKTDPNWDQWKKALSSNLQVENYYQEPNITENTLRQIFHLKTMLDTTGMKINDFDQIVDLGGGYGDMCKLAHKLGFKGKYIIYDWPEFSSLQKFYLSLNKIVGDIHFINDLGALKNTYRDSTKTLLIATWSLSETPTNFRDAFLDAINPDYYLITYQKWFGGVNNNHYFAELQLNKADVDWKIIPMRYLRTEENKYLIGMKK